MQIAVITDTHWGVRNDNPIFLDAKKTFLDETFFPEIERRGIKRVFHLGDLVDRRKYINFMTARRLRRDFIVPCKERGLEVDLSLGNHDTFFKNTNEVNSISELFTDIGPWFRWYQDPVELEVGSCRVLMVPWICDENHAKTLEAISSTTAQVCFGHVELAGFPMYKGLINSHGLDRELFRKFDVCGFGHFHTRTSDGNINYLGAPCEFIWSDYDDDRGFSIFDTETRTLEFIRNKRTVFEKVFYDDRNATYEDLVRDYPYSALEGKIIKVVVQSKVNHHWFETFITNLENAGVQDMQVVDDHLNRDVSGDVSVVSEAEDTLAIFHKTIDDMDDGIDKEGLRRVMTTLYTEALSLE